MTDTPHTPANRGWIVTFAGLGINLALGILYAWSLERRDRKGIRLERFAAE